jgi:3-deoxy-D-manno-octulosonic-acid transferase
MMGLYGILYGLTLVASAVLSPFVPKLRRGLAGRIGLVKRLKAAKLGNEPFWFHFASSGEFEQCLPLLEEIKRRQPQQAVLLTYFSPSGERAVSFEKKRRIESGQSIPWDCSDYAPFDLTFQVKQFMEVARPRAFISINREIWPRILAEGKRRNIPRFLLAVFLPERNESRFRYYERWTKLFGFVGTVDSHTARFLSQKLSPLLKVEQLGDPRIERVLSRKERQKKSPPWLDFFPKSRVNILCASIWPEDFQALKPSLQLPNARFVLVPHEPKESFHREIISWGKAHDRKFRLWSHWIREPDETSHLIVDEVGHLAEMYVLSAFVFVGGSFVSRIHNVLEPAAYGKPILTGPFIWNSAQALEWNELSRGLKAAKNGAELFAHFKMLLENESLRAEWSSFLLEWMQANRDVAKRYVDLILGKKVPTSF